MTISMFICSSKLFPAGLWPGAPPVSDSVVSLMSTLILPEKCSLPSEASTLLNTFWSCSLAACSIHSCSVARIRLGCCCCCVSSMIRKNRVFGSILSRTCEEHVIPNLYPIKRTTNWNSGECSVSSGFCVICFLGACFALIGGLFVCFINFMYDEGLCES